MDTKPLERFATQARRNLLAAVDARATAVLSLGSVARSEHAEAVKRLESEIAAHGQAHVIDKVAYTWFNRIVALRFMDARGYTNAGVVSPAQGQTHGQPEILADAKRGNVNTHVVGNKHAAEAIIGLLDGTRRSTDAEGEAYALLLTEYCRYWHRSMPFMFEREGDYTELLVPTGLLADGSILSRAREVLTGEVCDDVEVIGWLYQFYISERKAEVFEGFSAKGKTRTLAGPDQIPAATQLFTPHWIVRYLVENSVGRLWMLNRPTSRLIDKMDYYIAPIDDETEFLKIAGPEELTVIDPACGSGHMLTYAFDLLYAIYEEEGYAPSDIPTKILSYNLHGAEIDPRAGSLAAFALTMKARAKQRTFFSTQVDPRVCVIESVSFEPDDTRALRLAGVYQEGDANFWNQFTNAATLGSLIRLDPALTARLKHRMSQQHKDSSGGDIFLGEVLDRADRVLLQAEYLARSYAVLVANPPYMGKRNMGDGLRGFAAKEYPDSAGDLCTMFLERAAYFTQDGGFAALVVSESWLFNASFEVLRSKIIRSMAPVVTACLDKSAFGVRLNTAASVLSRSQSKIDSTFFRVSAADVSAGVTHLPPEQGTVYTSDMQQFEKVPGGSLNFDMPASLLALYGETRTVGDAVDLRQGLATTDNAQFVRFWWEVSRDRTALGCRSAIDASATDKRWFPYNKGGTPSPWWGNLEHVVDWEEDGKRIKENIVQKYPYLNGNYSYVAKNTQYYFRPAVTWSNIGLGGARFRMVPVGFIFDVSGMSAFTPDEETALNLLGYLNTPIVRLGLDVLAPTLNYQIGDVGRLPIVDGGTDGSRVTRLVEISRLSWSEGESSYGFESNPLVVQNGGNLISRVSAWRSSWVALDQESERLEVESNEYWCGRIAQESGITVPEVARGPRSLVSDRSSSLLTEDLVSYGIGCIFGRYSLDEPGLILADQGATLHDYLTKARSPSFRPDTDNVIPFVDDGWFEDDIVERFRQFLRTAFGAEHFEENLRFVEDSLGVKMLRDYFITKAGKSKFYDDHVQRYKMRPIYWMFSSPKGSFNALIYMHRYNASTVSTVLNEYLREYRAKLEVALTNADRAAAAGASAKDQKEADRLRKVLAELRDYEHDVLYPLATQQIAIDLDDGVKANYPKFYPALKKITGLKVAE